MGLGQPAVARRPQPAGAHPLGERALDPGPVGIVVGEGLGLLALPGGVDRLVFGLWLQRQAARAVKSASAKIVPRTSRI